MDAIEHLADHVVSRSYDDMPASALARAEVLVLDTVGVGIGGSSGPMARELADVQLKNGTGNDARVWVTGERLPAAAAALCNAYQIHNSEYDCVHEEAVAHVLSAVVPAAFAHAERTGSIDGRRFLEAVVLGADIASNLGVAASSGLRFFRPATVGAFGATAALGKLLGLDHSEMVNAFSLVYGQLCGTMQAHEEGSMLLAMQMGFNARNAVIACDMAAAGFMGPRQVLEGRFGYFGLFESEGDIRAVLPTLGHNWRIEEVAHKPFPSGRATHGILDACLRLRAEHSFDALEIVKITAKVPPLVHQLVGRPYRPEMDINYARLCAPYVAARGLVRGELDLSDFCATAYRDEKTRQIAELVTVEIGDTRDANALTPIEVNVQLASGSTFSTSVSDVYGAPDNPMSHEAQLQKFRANCAAAVNPMDRAQIEQLVTRLSDLEAQDNVADLVDLMISRRG